jgi:hypothetical protein
MQRIGKVAICIALLAAFAWPAPATASHTVGRVYGGVPSNHILLPWFEVGPLDGAGNPVGVIEDTNVVITNLWPLDGILFDWLMHVTIYDVHSIEVCDRFVPITHFDQYVTNISGIIQDFCHSDLDRQALAGPDDVWRGYAQFELWAIDSLVGGLALPIDQSLGFHNSLVGYIYQVKLEEGRAGGFDAPGYWNAGRPWMPLGQGQRLFFRFQHLFNKVDADASTQIVLWSESNFWCSDPPGFPFEDECVFLPDSCACLTGGRYEYCDEEEICTSDTVPPLCNEVNFLEADDFIGVSSADWHGDGGWFWWANQCPDKPSVLGYAQNQATTPDMSLNWEVIFPAQRGFTPFFDD